VFTWIYCESCYQKHEEDEYFEVIHIVDYIHISYFFNQPFNAYSVAYRIVHKRDVEKNS
jgi:hypothetical protein